MRPETRDPAHRWDPRPETLKVGTETETWDTYFKWDLRPKSQDIKRDL